MQRTKEAEQFYQTHRPRTSTLLPILKLMTDELLGLVGDEQLRALCFAVGSRLGETSPVSKIEKLSELEKWARQWLAERDWGWLAIEYHDDAVDLIHGDAPLESWFGDGALAWSAALFEGLYATWIRQLGADERLQLRQIRLADRPAGELRFRLAHESRFQ